MNTPKHKIFFGVPDGKVKGKTYEEYLASKDPGAIPGAKPITGIYPCFTWDADKSLFSSAKLRFDCDYDANELLERQLVSSGFTWDNEVVTMDTTMQMMN